MGFADVFGQVASVASITSAASSVASSVFRTTSGSPTMGTIGNALGGASTLGAIANVAGGVAGTAYGINNAAKSFGRINGSLLDPSNARLAMSGLQQLAGASFNAANVANTVSGMMGGGNGGRGGQVSFGQGGPGGGGGPNGMNRGGSVSAPRGDTNNPDWRVRLWCPVFGSSVIFPVTPQITVTDTAKYSSAGLVHSNYAMQFYESSEVSSIQANGEFPVQDADQGQLLLGAVYLLRAATKMFWGNSGNAGAPPPLVFIKGYNKGYLDNVPCVITNFTHNMPEDKDYIKCGGTMVPTLSSLQVTLQPVYSRNSLNMFNNYFVAAGNGGIFI